MFTEVKRGSAPQTDSSEVTKQDLVGEVVVFQVMDYLPDAQTQHGIQKQADVNLLVVTGPKAGESVEGWRTWGNLAKQMHAQGTDPVVAKVVAGPVKNGNPSWYGIDIAVTDDEFAAAQAAIGGGEKKAAKKQPSKAPF